MTEAEIRAQIAEAKRLIASLEAQLAQESPPNQPPPVAPKPPEKVSVQLGATGVGLSAALLAGGQLDLSTREGRLSVVIPAVVALLGKLGVFDRLKQISGAIKGT